MNVKQTMVYIHEPIRQIADRCEKASLQTKIEYPDEVAYIYGGTDLNSAEFGLSADGEPPLYGGWTHLLHSKPKQIEALAATLVKLGVRPETIRSATDWDENPLIDVELIKTAMAKVALSPTEAEPVGHLVLIDPHRMTPDQFKDVVHRFVRYRTDSLVLLHTFSAIGRWEKQLDEDGPYALWKRQAAVKKSHS